MTEKIHTPQQLIAFVQEGLTVRSLPEKAPEMAAYMKAPPETFYGVSGPGRAEVERQLWPRLSIRSATHYRQLVAALWELPHREERYLAVALARRYRSHITPDALPLYARMIREGAWWDLVDPIAVWLIGGVWQTHRDHVSQLMDRYIIDSDRWLRRTALIGQLQHRDDTDTERLYAYCLRCAPETDFFIRKAIGSALRQHSRTDPNGVRAFLKANEAVLSRLSLREGGRLLRAGTR